MVVRTRIWLWFEFLNECSEQNSKITMLACSPLATFILSRCFGLMNVLGSIRLKTKCGRNKRRKEVAVPWGREMKQPNKQYVASTRVFKQTWFPFHFRFWQSRTLFSWTFSGCTKRKATINYPYNMFPLAHCCVWVWTSCCESTWQCSLIVY